MEVKRSEYQKEFNWIDYLASKRNWGVSTGFMWIVLVALNYLEVVSVNYLVTLPVCIVLPPILLFVAVILCAGYMYFEGVIYILLEWLLIQGRAILFTALIIPFMLCTLFQQSWVYLVSAILYTGLVKIYFQNRNMLTQNFHKKQN